jgi:hypothetical protein
MRSKVQAKVIKQFWQHPYWLSMLSRVTQPKMAGSKGAVELLQLYANGFLSICRSSPLVFDFLAGRSRQYEVREIARELRDVELGSGDETHCNLFLAMLSSICDAPITVDEPAVRDYATALALEQGGVRRAIAIAQCIENILAPPLAPHFVALVTSLTRIDRFGQVDWRWAEIHFKAEGQSSKEQPDRHVDLINKLVKVSRCSDALLNRETLRWIRLTHAHLDQAWRRIIALNCS